MPRAALLAALVLATLLGASAGGVQVDSDAGRKGNLALGMLTSARQRVAQMLAFFRVAPSLVKGYYWLKSPARCARARARAAGAARPSCAVRQRAGGWARLSTARRGRQVAQPRDAARGARAPRAPRAAPRGRRPARRAGA
jgi:hypothetical protein